MENLQKEYNNIKQNFKELDLELNTKKYELMIRIILQWTEKAI